LTICDWNQTRFANPARFLSYFFVIASLNCQSSMVNIQMEHRLIKQGSTRALRAREYLFPENAEERSQSVEQASWPDLSSVAASASDTAVSKDDTAQAAVDLAQIEKTAYENGFMQGEKAGKEIAEQKAEAVMKRYSESIQEIGSFRSSLYAQVEHEVVRLAVEAAKKIVHREVQADPDIIQTLVRVALSHVSEKSAVTVHLSPVDYNYLMEQRAELAQNEGRDISLLSDKSIERGGCLIKTECGDIDARIEEKFREVESAFFEGIK
jgi:flagellar assembly protein FliH